MVIGDSTRALHMAVVVCIIHAPETRAYVEKRRSEGSSSREVRRCLKFYLARQLYRTLNELPLTPRLLDNIEQSTGSTPQSAEHSADG